MNSEFPQLERVDGVIERVTFHSEDSGYSVLRVKVRGHHELVTIVGVASSVTPGESIDCFGEWTVNREYGKQFRAKSIRTVPPSTIEGIEKYLGSGMVKGIGPHFAKRLVKAFGETVFDVIEIHPHRLRSVEGIGPKRIEKIVSAWKDQKIIRSIMVFLQSHGVSPAKAVRIFKTYGDSSVEKVKENPYQLARDIHGIGFKSADLIAEKLGIPKDSPLRAKVGISYVLMEKVREGHCAYPEAELVQDSSALLEIPPERIAQALQSEVNDKHLVPAQIRDRNCIYPAALYRCEMDLAQSISNLLQDPPPWKEMDLEKALHWVQDQIQMQLAPLQLEAVQTALQSKVSIITGGPGTGKSTLTRAILTIIKAKGLRIGLCSPTGRAAKRLAECTGMESKTIHRILGFDPKKGGFLHDQENPLPYDLLLIDEASMVDVQLAHSLIKAIPRHTALIVVGDVDQLPSVGPGQFLEDLIRSERIPTVRLTQIFRQAAASKIIRAAHQINQGDLPELGHEADSDFYFIQTDEADTAIAKILDLVSQRIPKKLGIHPMKDIQVLCPMQKGILGARNLNTELQKILNPNPASKVEKFGYTFCNGDKVMVIENDYDKEVFNGDIGFISAIDHEEQECHVQFDDKKVSFEFGELDILQPAYTITVHKSQGSEYPAIVIPLFMQHYVMLKRNLVYTGITRGKKFVVIVGQKKALAMAAHAFRQTERFTDLESRLRNLVEPKQKS